MNMREAESISGVPTGQHGEDGLFYCVGRKYFRHGADGKFNEYGPVTRITITDDLPGLHCNLERVRVYDGDTLIFEAPLHSLEGVTYPHPENNI